MESVLSSNSSQTNSVTYCPRVSIQPVPKCIMLPIAHGSLFNLFSHHPVSHPVNLTAAAVINLTACLISLHLLISSLDLLDLQNLKSEKVLFLRTLDLLIHPPYL
uniref:Uncharacterized protein n=1 Tax=Picea sitchensis TaxID=3332 RepID=A0A6B9XXV8_PICSI|nr:hypothetical protein Q903MT_gene6852 [Picea sitchensis]